MHSGTYHKPKRKQQPAPETASQAESEKTDLWEVMRPAHVRHASVATEFESILKDPIASAFHRGVVAGIEIAMDRLSKERVIPSDQKPETEMNQPPDENNGFVADPSLPLHDALGAIAGRCPPFPMPGVYHANELSEERFVELQEWANEKPVPFWATGLSMIDAANLIVEAAVVNANIPTRK